MKRQIIKRVEKDWGYELWLANNDLYCGKILHINRGHCSSWHYHRLKTETFYVLSGRLQVTYGWSDKIELAENKSILDAGDCFDIPIGMRHRLIAYDGDVEFLEISTTHYDDDSIRLEPGY